MTPIFSDYLVLCGNSPVKLATEVKTFLGYGWVPQGGMVVEVGTTADRYYQAMVKPVATTPAPQHFATAPNHS